MNNSEMIVDNQQGEASTPIELSDLQLAMIGGGSGDTLPM